MNHKKKKIIESALSSGISMLIYGAEINSNSPILDAVFPNLGQLHTVWH